MREMLQKLAKARTELAQTKTVCFTSDIDWASEFAIEKSISFFRDANVPITYFLTHPSAAIQRSLDRGEIRAGLHPNFMPDSSQGASYDEVMDYCFKLLPGARGFRSHRHYDVNDVLEKFKARGIEYDSNVCTLLDELPPFLHRTGLVRFPIFIEDGGYLLNGGDLRFANVADLFDTPGLKVINLHPMHLLLNTPYFKYTREIKDRLSRSEWNHLDDGQIAKLAFEGRGITSFIEEMVDFFQKKGFAFRYLEDVYDWILTL